MSTLRNKSVVAVIDNLTAKEAARLSGAIQIKKATIAPCGRGKGYPPTNPPTRHRIKNMVK